MAYFQVSTSLALRQKISSLVISEVFFIAELLIRFAGINFCIYPLHYASLAALRLSRVESSPLPATETASGRCTEASYGSSSVATPLRLLVGSTQKWS